MNDTQDRIGKLIDGDAERDAIHIAVVPAIADEKLWPGSSVKLRHGTTDRAVGISDYYRPEEVVGIVDPFLKERVDKGERFWIFLLPGTVTGMRHHWAHPRFDHPSVPESEHEAWLREFAENWRFDFDEMIEEASSQGEERCVVAYGRDIHYKDELGADYELFWYHLEGYLGRQFSPEHREGLSWSCSC